MQERIPAIGVLVAQDNNVLLVRHGEAASHLTGTYGLPGGRLEEGEDLVKGAVRELSEETGLTVKAEDLVHLPHVFYADIPRKGGEIASMTWNVFVAKTFSGELKSGDQETVPEWIPLEDIQRLKNLLPNTEEAIKEGLQLLEL